MINTPCEPPRLSQSQGLLFDHLQYALINGPNIPSSYAILFFAASDFTPITGISTTGHYFCFGSISSFFLELFLQSSPIAYWVPSNPGEFIFQYYIFLPFHTIYGVLKARVLKWFASPFSSGPYFIRTLHYDLSVLDGLAWHGSELH